MPLLPICRKFFEMIVFGKFAQIFPGKQPNYPKALRFSTWQFYIKGLLLITHENWKSFDETLEARSIFLHISKECDKVWHEGIILKVKQNGISDNLLDTFSDFLNNKKQ